MSHLLPCIICIMHWCCQLEGHPACTNLCHLFSTNTEQMEVEDRGEGSCNPEPRFSMKMTVKLEVGGFANVYEFMSLWIWCFGRISQSWYLISFCLVHMCIKQFNGAVSVNMTAHICWWLPLPAINRYHLPTVCSAANPLQVAAAVDRWNRRMDDRCASVSLTLLHILCGRFQWDCEM